MTTVRHWGAAAASTPFPTLERRSIAVNTFTRQIAVGDEAASQVGTPLPMIAVRYFDPRAPYALNDIVVQGGVLYKAKGLISPGAFNATQWTAIDNTSLGAAAPLDAIAYNGMQINGSMEVNQAGVSATAHNTYFCDGWKLLKTGTMVMTGQRAVAPFFPVFTSLAQITVGTAQPSLGTGDFAGIFQPIEGYCLARLGWGAATATPITICFWSRHVRAGLYSGTVRNGAANRSYAFTYTQAAADTPQYNTITVPGDQTGTWTTDNTVGIYLAFSNGCGATLTAPSANAWLGGSYLAAPGQVNGVAATSDIFRITGVAVLPGAQTPTAAQSPLIMRPYDQELVACQRYWQIYSSVLVGGYNVAGQPVYADFTYPLMRAAPTFTTGTISYTNASGLSLNQPQTNHIRLTLTVTATGYGYGQGDMFLDARL